MTLARAFKPGLKECNVESVALATAEKGLFQASLTRRTYLSIVEIPALKGRSKFTCPLRGLKPKNYAALSVSPALPVGMSNFEHRHEQN
jgi:hypothetical protein